MSNVKAVFWAVVLFVVFLIVVAGLTFFGNGVDFLNFKFFAPKGEEVRHQTFECSASHSDGMAREIRQYQDQYNALDPADPKTPGSKVVIRQRVLQDAESQDSDACPFPSDVQAFVSSLR